MKKKIAPDAIPWEWLTTVVRPHRRKPEWDVVVDGEILVRGQAWNATIMLASCLKQLPNGKQHRVEVIRR